MNLRNTAAALTGIVVLAGALAGPFAGTAFAQNRQNDKNNMRNLGLAGAAGAVYEATHGKGTNALILGAGAAYAGKKYEDDRKAQNKAAAHRKWVAAHRRHHYTHHH
jgi:hypothetical protein